MPIVFVEMWEGRTVEQKKKLIQDITEAVTKMGPPPEHVQVIIRDYPKHNWSKAGKLASEPDYE